MRTTPFLLALPLLVACENESGLGYVKDYGGIYESTLTGRACDANSGRWLEGAVVYTHILNDANELIDTRETYTDADGLWTLEELRGGQNYTVYIQYGNDIVDMFDVDVPDNAEIEVPTPNCGADLGRVAVITGDYDDWESVLPEVGVTNYEVVNGLTGEELAQFLSDGSNLADYGALFFAGGHIEEDVVYDSDGSDTSGVVDSVKSAIKTFVSEGGFVYASDWSYDVIELCWDDKITFLREDQGPDAAQLGEPDVIRANIVNEEMANAVGGDRRDVTFDLDTWPVMKAIGDNVKVHEKAEEVPYREGTEQSTLEDSPVTVSFKHDSGKVVFTSWRVAANLEGRGTQVIEYLLEE